ncbi:MAG: hypothetical protein QM638_17730 [Nocardioides sp.]|uniref:hypothetical protein n=1 Tax=Nocardioides sp. TaxID=35761 RepID=UPI0039E46D2C
MVRDLGTDGGAPSAVRATRPGWRDPRLWLGVAIVAACVVAGARIIGAADDSVEVWSLRAGAAPGSQVDQADLARTRVRFADADDLAGYFPVGEELPDELELVRAVGAGELLPRSAVGTVGDSGLLQLPVSVDPGQLPPAIATGSVVDLYVGAGSGTDGHARGTPLIGRAPVIAVVSAAESLSGSGQAQVTVAVSDTDAHRYFRVVSGLDSPVITVVGRPSR